MSSVALGLKFGRLPTILSVQLKRFVNDFSGGTAVQTKLNDPVKFPMVLDMNKYVATRTVQSADSCQSSFLEFDGNEYTFTDNHVNNVMGNAFSANYNSMTDEQVQRLIKDHGEWVYELYSVLVHSGTTTDGHYLAYIKDLDSKRWWCFNDSDVTPIDESTVREAWGALVTSTSSTSTCCCPYNTTPAMSSSSNAYMLMYRKICYDPTTAVSFPGDDVIPEHVKSLIHQEEERRDSSMLEMEGEQVLKKEGSCDTFHLVVDCCPVFTIDSDVMPPTNPSDCRHVYCEAWGDKFMCIDCIPKKEITELEFPDIYKREMEKKVEIGIADSSSHADSVRRGVSIEFLVSFCNKYNLWDVPTREVRRKYVIPMTSKRRCRFVELPGMVESGIVGHSSTFVSHCWDAKFGNVVAALCDGVKDLKRKIWLDVFAVRQWCSTANDLDFEIVIRNSLSFMIVIPYLPAVENYSLHELFSSTGGLLGLSEEDLSQIFFLRVWCLYELFYAAIEGKNIIVKAGCHVPPKTSVNSATHYHSFENKPDMLIPLIRLVDVNRAMATNPADRDFIFGKIQEYPGGAEGLNEKVRGALAGAVVLTDGNSALVQCAASGDENAASVVLQRAGQYVTHIAAGGYLSLLEEIAEADSTVFSRCPEVVNFAARGGHLRCVEFLIARRAAVNTKNRDGLTALMLAAMGGHSKCLESLVSNGAAVDADSKDSRRAIMFAAMGGHLKCLELLVNRRAAVDTKDRDGRTAVMFAAQGGHFECLELLINSGAAVDAKSVDEFTAAMFAAQGGHLRCLEFLVLKGAPVDTKNRDGWTAAMFAAQGDHFKCLEFLLSKVAAGDPAATDVLGTTGTMIAAMGGHLHCLELLASKGASVDARNSNGMTAAKFAEMGGHHACLEFLVSKGATMDTKVKDG